MIDALTSLAHQLQRKQGSYALLIGSGVSSAASIPTGWGIILDLIRRVAACQKEDCGDDPAGWYRANYNKEPSYSELLAELGSTPAERSQIIRDYIEPSDDERELGLKVPTEAHRSIAELVAGGYLRVILTTNFDKLLEIALGELGIVPDVIDGEDAVAGTLPLVHNACTVIKLHGDYIDARIKNTTDELAEYPMAIEVLLDQVLTEYGLIICGWSGQWDTALIDSLNRTKSPWFGTYWNSYREPRPEARPLLEFRDAKVISNMDADSFFSRLLESVTALEDLDSPETVSVAIANASVKRYIDDPNKRIRLHDLVVGEAKRIRSFVEERPNADFLLEVDREEVQRQLTLYENRTQVLRTVLVTGCYWGTALHDANWVSALERLVNLGSMPGSFIPIWERLRSYPALLALYSAGIAAVAARNYSALRAIFYDTTAVQFGTGAIKPYIHEIRVGEVGENVERVTGTEFLFYLANHDTLWNPIREYVPIQAIFKDYYDHFEYLLGLAYTDQALRLYGRGWGPPGFFARRQFGHFREEFLNGMDQEIEASGTAWGPLAAGMFDGSLERLNEVKASYHDDIMGR